MNRKQVIFISLGVLLIVGVFVAFYYFSDKFDGTDWGESKFIVPPFFA